MVYLRSFGLISLLAFLSAWTQLSGLVGESGILPLDDFLKQELLKNGILAYLKAPTLSWLLPSYAANLTLSALCAMGALSSLFIIAGLFQGPSLFLLYLSYLSITVNGQDFFAFQWDGLLLEMAFLSLWICPWTFRPSHEKLHPPQLLPIWALRFLFLRMVFSSGIAKLCGGDPLWTSFTALDVYFQNQVSPSPLAWYAHFLNPGIHHISGFLVLVIEIGLPLLVLGSRQSRLFTFLIFNFYQILIIATGNYGFLNLLSFCLSITLLDDRTLQLGWLKPVVFLFGRLPAGAVSQDSEITPSDFKRALRRPKFLYHISEISLILLMFLGLLQIRFALYKPFLLPKPVDHIESFTRYLHVVNPFSFFANMPPYRPEIILEGSWDGIHWQEYNFRYKPTETKRIPTWVIPHMPRLDWQMSIAALGYYKDNIWMGRLLQILLENSPAVELLLGHNPFPHQAPRQVRALLYRYRFASPELRKNTGQWWERQLLGLYSPVVTR